MVRRKRVLIVDDDPDILELMRSILSLDAFEIQTASDGVEASTKIWNWQPHLVVLDFMMPGLMDGFEICTVMGLSQLARRIPVLAVTALRQEDDIERIRQSGVRDYLAKPFRAEELVEKASRIVFNERT